jgi:hypothetical protein
MGGEKEEREINDQKTENKDKKIDIKCRLEESKNEGREK